MKYLYFLKILLPLMLVSLLVVSPTLFDQHWALLDDAAILKTLGEGYVIPDEGNGRYRPLYWLYYALQYKFFDTQVNYYYLIQAIMLVLSNCLIYLIVNLLTRSKGFSWFAVITFLTSSSLAENYYTISKQEPRLVVLLLSSLYFYLRAEATFHKDKEYEVTSKKIRWIYSLGWLAVSTISLIFAYLTKETTVIVLIASIAWLLFDWYVVKIMKIGGKSSLSSIGFLIVNISSFLVSAIISYGYKSTTLPWDAKYTQSSFNFNFNFQDMFLYAKINFDVVTLTIFSLVSLTAIVFFIPRIYNKVVAYAALCFLCSLIYSILFSSFWTHKLAYYSLPIASWNSIAVALLTQVILSKINAFYWRNLFITTFIFTILLVLSYSLPTHYNVAIAHKAWTKVNNQMLEEIAKLPSQSQILFNYNKNFQYLNDTNLLLNTLYNRSDINIGSMFESTDLLLDNKNKILLANFGGQTNNNVMVRAMNPPIFQDFKNWSIPIKGLEFKEIFSFQISKNIVVPFTFQSLPFSLGWNAYHISKLPEIFIEKYGDGWIGKETNLWIDRRKGIRKVSISGKSLLPLNTSYPIYLDIWKDSVKVESLAIKQPGNFKLTLNLSVLNNLIKEEEYIRLRIKANKTFVPSRDGINKDTRELSVLIDDVQTTEF
jgi:hypothetical protein